MNIEIKDNLLMELGDIPNIMNETIEEYVTRAILTQMQIDQVVLEKDIYDTEELHSYPIMRGDAFRLKAVLEDKGIPSTVYQKDKKTFIEAKIKPQDFQYVCEISYNHMLPIKLPSSINETSKEKIKQLQKMYHTTVFSEA